MATPAHLNLFLRKQRQRREERAIARERKRSSFKTLKEAYDKRKKDYYKLLQKYDINENNPDESKISNPKFKEELNKLKQDQGTAVTKAFKNAVANSSSTEVMDYYVSLSANYAVGIINVITRINLTKATDAQVSKVNNQFDSNEKIKKMILKNAGELIKGDILKAFDLLLSTKQIEKFIVKYSTNLNKVSKGLEKALKDRGANDVKDKQFDIKAPQSTLKNQTKKFGYTSKKKVNGKTVYTYD